MQNTNRLVICAGEIYNYDLLHKYFKSGGLQIYGTISTTCAILY